MLVQRIDIDTEVIKIIFRVTQNTRGSGSDSIAIAFRDENRKGSGRLFWLWKTCAENACVRSDSRFCAHLGTSCPKRFRLPSRLLQHCYRSEHLLMAKVSGKLRQARFAHACPL